MNKNMKKGIILIENLIALVYIAIILLPFSNMYIKVFNTNTLIEQKEEDNIILENIFEYIESLDYKVLENKSGNHSFSSINDFINFFEINISKNENNKKIEILIDIQKTNSFYLNQKHEKLYILKIKINKKEFFYLPSKEDYEK